MRFFYSFAILILASLFSMSAMAQEVSGRASSNADFEVRLSAIEEQFREVTGKLEESEFKNKKLAENLEKLQKDTDFRFNELAKTQAQPVAQPQPIAQPATKKDKSAKSKEQSIGKTIDSADDDTANAVVAETEFASAHDHYNYAFRQLNQTQYDTAAASFADFTKKYPKDPLIGNAYYWLGETFYIRRDFVGAADNFREGFEKMPTGTKAPDNLLKLAMSLDALKRDKEACVVLGQIITKFKKTAAAVTQKAQAEQKRIACE